MHALWEAAPAAECSLVQGWMHSAQRRQFRFFKPRQAARRHVEALLAQAGLPPPRIALEVSTTAGQMRQILRDTDRDNFMSAAEGVEYGIIDEVLVQKEKEEKEKKKLEDVRNELIKKHGEEKDGNVAIETFIDEAKTQVNPKFIEFQNEFGALLDQEKEFSYKPLALADVESIETAGNCPIFLKLLVAE